MKRGITIILTLAMLFSLSSVAFAAEPMTETREIIVSQNEYSFNILEKIDENFQTTRTYIRPDVQAYASSDSIVETRALLVALGMDEDAVDNLSASGLQNFANGSTISVTTSYAKYDKDGNATPLPENVAIMEATQLQNQRRQNFISGISPYANPDYEESTQDGYLLVTHAVTDISTSSDPGCFFFSTDAEWLAMPAFRSKDSLGSCSMDCTVTNNTRYGNYSYDIITNNGIDIIYDNVDEDITDIKNAPNGNWYGSAGIFNLPNDAFGEGVSVMNENFAAHYEYEGYVTSPDERRNFNTIGSYAHSYIRLSLSPSLSIDLGSGGVSANIGISAVDGDDRVSVEYSVHYVP